EGSLAFRVFSAERDDWVAVTTLSHGTRDQLYLAARLGLVRQITGDHQPPLILDDPFVSFDDDRAARAVQLLRLVGADFQVILLTCSSRYNALADRVVELPGPVLRDVPALDQVAAKAPFPAGEPGAPTAAPSRAPAATVAAALTGTPPPASTDG